MGKLENPYRQVDGAIMTGEALVREKPILRTIARPPSGAVAFDAPTPICLVGTNVRLGAKAGLDDCLQSVQAV